MNVCFLFGAGAETELNLPNGSSFAKSVLGINQDKMNKAIQKNSNLIKLNPKIIH